MNTVPPVSADLAYERRLHPIHETRQRLRFRLPFLADRKIDFAWLETKLENISGVAAVRINRPARSVIFSYDGSPSTRAAILTTLKDLPRARIPNGEPEPTQPAERIPLAATAGLIATLPLMPLPLRAAATFANIAMPLLRGADTFVRRGIKVEVLDALALGFSAIRGDFFATNITRFLMQLGGYLEESTERQSDHMLRRLLVPEPVLAWVERDGTLQHVLDTDIQAGDRVEVGLGDRIPVDGLVIDGTAQVDQSSLTGEPLPVRKEVMDRVVAGSIVVEGHLRVEARHVGEDTTTARISQFISQSLSQTSQTQRLSERMADRRVYLTLGTGLGIFLLTGDLRRLAAIFQVDYSCSLKLGTPLAFKSGLYHAANEGILLKGGDAIEHLAAIDTIVFDKTGTLTESALQVTDVLLADPDHWTRERLLALTASIEEHASHPIAEAITAKAREEHLTHVDHGEIAYLVAHGMSCPVKGETLFIGSRHYLEEHIGLSFQSMEDAIEDLSAQGKTVLYIGHADRPLGVIGLRDRIRQDAGKVLATLRLTGVNQTVMLTGDARDRADALGHELGLDRIFAELEPEQKALILKQLRDQGRKVAFVGDGVNDGPAMAAADVGIAMAHGAEIARAAADAVLLEDRLALLPNAVSVSQRTMRLVDTNYKAAIGINTAIMIGAALGLLSPVTTAILHNGTTVGLLLRALNGFRAK